MQSRNPVFANNDNFNGKARGGYGDPASWQIDLNGNRGGYDGNNVVSTGRMTVDSVVQKSAITLGLLFVAAAVTWVSIGDVTVDANFKTASTLSTISLIIAFVLAMVNNFKKSVSPGLVLGYAVFEGVALGAVSKVFETAYDGVVSGALLGTVAAFAGTLAAYKFFNIKVGPRYNRMLAAAGFGFVGVMFLDIILGAFGHAIGFNGFGPLGLIFSIVGVGLGVFFLISDFDYVERGVAAGLPERESWRAAFGLTLTLVWLYIEFLRLLSILRD